MLNFFVFVFNNLYKFDDSLVFLDWEETLERILQAKSWTVEQTSPSTCFESLLLWGLKDIFVRGYNFVRNKLLFRTGIQFFSWAVSRLCARVNKTIQLYLCCSWCLFCLKSSRKKKQKNVRESSAKQRLFVRLENWKFCIFFPMSKPNKNIFNSKKIRIYIHLFHPLFFWKIEILNEYLLGSKVSQFSLH